MSPVGPAESDHSLASVAPSRLAGRWTSDLGSELALVEEVEGCLSGTYRSAVGGTVRSQPLTGRCVRLVDGSAVLGFVVGWPGTGSLATWTGRHQPATQRIVATWVLESSSTEATTWQATRLGYDVFHRPPHRAEDDTP